MPASSQGCCCDVSSNNEVCGQNGSVSLWWALARASINLPSEIALNDNNPSYCGQCSGLARGTSETLVILSCYLTQAVTMQIKIFLVSVSLVRL